MSTAMVPFTLVPNAILEDPSMTPAEKTLYFLILKFAGQTGRCWASQVTMGEHMGRSDRQIRNILKSLAEKRLIKVDYRGEITTNVYVPQFTVQGKTLFQATGKEFPVGNGNKFPPNKKRRKEKKKVQIFDRGKKLSDELFEQRNILIKSKSMSSIE